MPPAAAAAAVDRIAELTRTRSHGRTRHSAGATGKKLRDHASALRIYYACVIVRVLFHIARRGQRVEKRMRTGCAGREIHRAMPLMMNRGGRKRSLAPLAYLCKIFSAESSATSSVIIVIIIVVQKYKLESSDVFITKLYLN